MLSAAEHAGASEFDARASRAVAARATTMARLARLSEPAFRYVGVRPDALPLSMLWLVRGALLVRRRIRERVPDVVLATGPPIAGPLAARLGVGAEVPLVVELRDLWAGSPAFDAGGSVLANVEEWLLRGARRVVACTPEAVSDLRLRHPHLGERVLEISNGFDPQISSIAAGLDLDAPRTQQRRAAGPITLLHSGTLSPARPITPLLRALADPRLAGCFRLVLHGYLSPATRAELEAAGEVGDIPIEVLAPSHWQEAVTRIAQADACVILQGRAAGDQTAIASKIYEYLALRKPVVCVTDGGASEALLRRLGADQLCARLDAPESIVAALLRLRAGAPPVPARARLQAYDRRVLAGRMAALLDGVAQQASTSTIRSAA